MNVWDHLLLKTFYLFYTAAKLGPHRVTGLHTVEIHNLYSASIIIRVIITMMRWDGHVTRIQNFNQNT
jgi:hypothetical protein